MYVYVGSAIRIHGMSRSFGTERNVGLDLSFGSLLHLNHARLPGVPCDPPTWQLRAIAHGLRTGTFMGAFTASWFFLSIPFL